MDTTKNTITGNLHGNMVYICSPLSAPTGEGIRHNMEKANIYAENISSKLNCRAIAPHGFLPDHFDDKIPEERQLCLGIGLMILHCCKALIVCGRSRSSGMLGEIAEAEKTGIPVLYYDDVMDDGNTVPL